MTPSDSQGELRRRDDAVELRLDGDIMGQLRALGWRHPALHAQETDQLRATVARLEAERDDYRRRLDFAEVTAGRVAQERDEALRLERQVAHELGLTVAERDEARALESRVWDRIRTWQDDPETRLRAFALTAEKVEALKADRDSWRRVCERLEGEKVAARVERDEVWADLAIAETERDAAMDIVRDIVDDDPCDYDHHDYCQTHGLHSRPCVNERAITLIAAVDLLTQQAAPVVEEPLATGGLVKPGQVCIVGEKAPELLTEADVERWYAGQTAPRELAYKAVWLMLVQGLATPAVWRPVNAALDAYEAAAPVVEVDGA